jgi:UDP-N-acetylglucosamine--N-acetylmuramyl-(pentapeptide) pyrophosphoryl-undecaprenol N-acetylglucosamine transferase
VYPGLAVAQALLSDGGKGPAGEWPLEVVYVGSAGGVEESLVARTGLPFYGVEAAGLHGLGAARAAKNAIKLLRGVSAAYRLGRQEPPEAVFATGGYASIPPAVAAAMMRVPIMVYLPDVEPGLAVRFIARLARKVAVTTSDSAAFFPPGKTVVTGYPVRSELSSWDRQRGRAALELAADLPVLLVLGGSKGARSINRALGEQLDDVLSLAEVVHVSGRLDWPQVAERRNALPEHLRSRYHAYDYMHEEMGAALAAADLAVCRAGASVLGELPLFGLPAILVPYPHAWRYQRVNAEWLASRGAAVLVEDEELSERLVPAVRGLLERPERLKRMAERAAALARPGAASRLADELLALAAGGRSRRAQGAKA